MNTFEIDGTEYEVKITYKSQTKLNNLYEGGTMGLVANVIQGALSSDLDLFLKVVHAGLIHTGKGFTMKKVEDSLEEKIDNNELSSENIAEILDTVVLQSFFYRPVVKNMVEMEPQVAEGLKMIRGKKD